MADLVMHAPIKTLGIIMSCCCLLTSPRRRCVAEVWRSCVPGAHTWMPEGWECGAETLSVSVEGAVLCLEILVMQQCRSGEEECGDRMSHTRYGCSSRIWWITMLM